MLTQEEFAAARERAAQIFAEAGITLTDAERSAIEIADFGLSKLQETGLEIVVYVNTERVAAKELAMFPRQICPEHRHPPFDGTPGKEETFRCRAGTVYVYTEGEPAPHPHARVPADGTFTAWHEIVLRPGEQYTVPPDTLHWFQAGDEGAIVSEFSTRSRDDLDIFTDPRIERATRLAADDRCSGDGQDDALCLTAPMPDGIICSMSDHLINMRGAADLHADGTEPAEQADGRLRESLYRRMLLIRRFEERVYRLFLEGEIPGTLHQYQGQEAVAVGVCDVLTRDDWITSTHRPHGHALAKGVSTSAAMAELYGRRTGCCRGKGGSMHLGDPDVGMLPAIAIVGGGNTVVTGLGLAMKLRRRSQVAVCFFGEGATNEGAFHEGINFAAVERLPVVLVCENNLYGASTPYSRVALVPDVAERAKAYGVPARIVDGMDVMAVRAAARDAVAAARAGAGPTLLECKTYRFTGHSRSDARGYRTRAEEARWAARDPLLVLGANLDEATLGHLEAEVKAELDDAVEFARNSPFPEPGEATEDVYA